MRRCFAQPFRFQRQRDHHSELLALAPLSISLDVCDPRRANTRPRSRMRTIENCTPLASVSLSQLIVSSSQTAMIEVMVSDWVDLDSRNSMLVRLLTMWLLVAQNCQLPV